MIYTADLSCLYRFRVFVRVHIVSGFYWMSNLFLFEDQYQHFHGPFLGQSLAQSFFLSPQSFFSFTPLNPASAFKASVL